MTTSKDYHFTTKEFAQQGQSVFISLDGQESLEEIKLADLESAIYFAWHDFRVKFRFKKDIDLRELIEVVEADDDSNLLNVIDKIIFEVRPISMQNSGEEIDWLLFIYGLFEQIYTVSEYVENWDYLDSKDCLEMALYKGLDANIYGRNLGDIGLELAYIASDSLNGTLSIGRLIDRFKTRRSSADDINDVFEKQGIVGALDHMTLKRRDLRKSNITIA